MRRGGRRWVWTQVWREGRGEREIKVARKRERERVRGVRGT